MQGVSVEREASMYKKAKLFFFIFLLAVASSGCMLLVAGAVGGTGTAVWLSDKLSQEVNAPFEKSINAATEAMKSLKLDIVKKTVKEDVAQIIGTYSDGRKMWIDVRPVSSSTSRVDIRVGALGDEVASRKILDKILRHL